MHEDIFLKKFNGFMKEDDNGRLDKEGKGCTLSEQ
jgi:hypothetical protein